MYSSSAQAPSSGQKYDPCKDPKALADECGSAEFHTILPFLQLNSPLPSAKENLEKACQKLQLGSMCAILVTNLSGNPTPKPPGPTPGGPKLTDLQ